MKIKEQQEQLTSLRLLNAVQPNWINRADYSNRVKQRETVTVITEDGTSYQTEVEFFISWESIQEILKLVLKKADIADEFSASGEPQSQ